jgi:protein O-mannosyl-transferase
MTSDTPSSSRSAYLSHYLLLLVLTIGIFYPVYREEFNWDDDHVINAGNLHGWDNLVSIWLHPAKAILQDYMPLTHSLAWAEYQIWGMRPGGYHLISLLLHALNAMVLLALLRRMQTPGALLVAILFTLHPMQASTVAWVSQQKTLLSALFYFLAFFPWLRLEKDNSRRNYAWAALLFFAAMLSKRMTISWPVAAFILSWWRTGHVDRQRLIFLLTLFALGMGLSEIVPLCSASSASQPEQFQVLHLEFLQKILLVGRNLTFYLTQLLWPVVHVPSYPHWSLDMHALRPYLYPAISLLLTGGLWGGRKRFGRGPLAALLFHMVVLFPILGMIPWSLMNMTFVQDHYQYIACLGPFLLVAAGWERVLGRVSSIRHARPVAYAVLTFAALLPCAVLARRHASLYQDRETLFHENYVRYPQANMVANHYAYGLTEKGKYPEAYLLIDGVTKRQPLDPINWRLKAQILWKLNRLEEACDAYEKTLTLIRQFKDTPTAPPLNPDTLYQYGLLLLQMHRPDKAVLPLRDAAQQTQGKIPEIQTALHQAENDARGMIQP